MVIRYLIADGDVPVFNFAPANQDNSYHLTREICALRFEEMQPGITIRLANERDLGTAYSLIVALGYPHLAMAEFDQTFRTILAHPETIVLLAVDDAGQAIGLMAISHRPQLRLAGTILCIDELVVSDVARGRGAGRALLNTAKRIAKKVGAKRIELHTRRTRESYQRKFYVKNGFTEADSALMRLEKADFNYE